MTSRFKSLGFGSKRKSSNSIQTTQQQQLASPNGSISTAPTPPPPSASQTSLPQSNQQQLGRPPSYTYNTATGRPQSPMPPPGQQQMAHHPPPIDTRQYAQNPGMPQQPPGYGGGGYGQIPQPVQQMGQYGQHARPAEVEGGGRSKAQLIVGIDFVRFSLVHLLWPRLIDSTGNNLLRCRICLCDQHGSKRGHNNGMARCW